MENASSTAKLDMCESAKYDLNTGRFTSHGARRRRNHCSPRAQRIAIVILVVLLMVIIGLLMAMFGPGNTDLVYKTAKQEGPQRTEKTEEPPTEVPTRPVPTTTDNGTPVENGSTATPTRACATPGPTSPPAKPDVTCDVAIVGAGLAGLYMANKLTNTTRSVCVLEKNARVGGRIFDDHFSAAPNASVGLGAWGMETNAQFYMVDKFYADFNITKPEGRFSDNLSLHRARGITVAKAAGDDVSSLCDALRTQAFSSLRQRPYTNETCKRLIDRVLKDNTHNAANFSTAGTYLSNFLTSEGSKLISEFYGVKSDYLHLIRPAEYIEFLRGREDELRAYDGYYRPTRGMSDFVRGLNKSAGKRSVFLDNAVLSISSARGKFHLQTDKLVVSADKVVLALPPVALAKIKGDVTEKITRHAIFRSILSVPAFKAAAVYRDAWWPEKLQPRKTFTSYDSCLGVTMPDAARGDNGEAILYTAYAHGACAKKWGVLAEQQGRGGLESAMQRALAEKFDNDTIPTPLETKHKYWEDGALHFQKAGSNFTKEQVLSWAARPVAEQAVFLAGDAYYNYGYVCEHALQSAAALLKQEWNIPPPSDLLPSD